MVLKSVVDFLEHHTSPLQLYHRDLTEITRRTLFKLLELVKPKTRKILVWNWQVWLQVCLDFAKSPTDSAVYISPWTALLLTISFFILCILSVPEIPPPLLSLSHQNPFTRYKIPDHGIRITRDRSGFWRLAEFTDLIHEMDEKFALKVGTVPT